MSQYTLTVVETSGIQPYIFGSNNLQHNIGASALVDKVTRDWVYETVNNLGPTNVTLTGDMDDHRAIESKSLDSELIYAGGGNAVILFRTHDLAEQFTKILTRRTLLDAPGLELVVAHTDFDWHTERALSLVVRDTLLVTKRKKMSRACSAPVLGLGVTADCQFTGLPAVDKDQEGRRISAEVQAKLDEAKTAHEQLVHALELPEGYDIPKDFDDFGRTRGESSYIAVIHTDGNGMGRRIRGIAEAYPTPERNREYVRAMRAFSESVFNAADQALKAVVRRLIDSIREVDGRPCVGGVVEVQLRQERQTKILPFRPLVIGGDDVTFVCDGRLGLTLSALYLQEFTSTVLMDGKPPFARAGIAIVKTHYPFARAYDLADDLAESAKGYLYKQTNGEKNLTALDWHVALGHPVLDLKELREREYSVSINEHSASLLIRPFRLGPLTITDWHSWEVFEQIVRGFINPADAWYGRRNKVKALRSALRAGPEAVKQFLRAFDLSLPDAPQVPELASDGWKGYECGYFDAIEAMDFFVPLEGGSR